HNGTSSPCGEPKNTAPPLVFALPSNSHTHTEPMRNRILNRCPQLVRCTPLMVAPKPAATKNTPNISPPAAGFHFTHAESAMASSDRTRIQIHDPKNIPEA